MAADRATVKMAFLAWLPPFSIGLGKSFTFLSLLFVFIILLYRPNIYFLSLFRFINVVIHSSETRALDGYILRMFIYFFIFYLKRFLDVC